MVESFSERLLFSLIILSAAGVWVVLRGSRFRGLLGELRVRAVMALRLNGTIYRSLHDLTLPTSDGTTQIDHVVVSKFGVFVIETKNMKGWIFGDASSRKWTQSIYGKSYPFQNPLRQNYRHVKALEHLLGLPPRCFHSVVVFVGASKFKAAMPPNVVTRRRLVRTLESKTEILLSDEQVDASVDVLERSRLSKIGTRRRHVKALAKSRRDHICPRCGQPMVLRTASRGRNAGGRFWGCSGFPACRATRPVE